MEIIITEWALNSYLELRQEEAFSRDEYMLIIRPDVLRLKSYPYDAKFANGKFWSLVQDGVNKKIINGYKMKWHQMGNGRVQLRLTVGILRDTAFLCEAYVKHNEKEDKRRLARFKVYLELIQKNRYTIRGALK